VAKDEFNFDDFEYSGVKLSPVPDLGQEAPAEEVETARLPDAPAAAAEIAPLAEPEDKKAKKKAKKEKKPKPAKVKKAVVTDDRAEAKTPSPFLQTLSQASPYTVLLGIAVVMLLLAVILLFIELGRYDFNTKAISLNGAFRAPVASPVFSECDVVPAATSDVA
jgi:hypothetical protein